MATTDNKETATDNDAVTEKKKKKRRTKIYRYPSNIGSDEQPHAINFYIFKTESEKEADSRTKQLKELDNAGDKDAAKQLAVENGRQEFNKDIASIGAGTAAGTALGGKKAARSTIVAAAVATGTSALFDKATAMKARSTRKIDSSISLYIPNSPQAKYGAEFNIEDLGTILGGVAGGDANITQTFNKMKGLVEQGEIGKALEAAAGSPMGSVLARSISSAADLPRELGLGNLNVSGAIRSATRTVRNPYKEQIFQTMGFRSFAFEYKFAPRNEKELRDVMEIIKLFKTHMHPEKDLGGLFFTFPSEFQIEYVYKNRKNTYLNKMAPCFLTDLSVDYGNGGTFTTFKDARGAPSEITMSMAFKETELLTRSKVEEGF
jgi:hypothetical protein